MPLAKFTHQCCTGQCYARVCNASSWVRPALAETTGCLGRPQQPGQVARRPLPTRHSPPHLRMARLAHPGGPLAHSIIHPAASRVPAVAAARAAAETPVAAAMQLALPYSLLLRHRTLGQVAHARGRLAVVHELVPPPVEPLVQHALLLHQRNLQGQQGAAGWLRAGASAAHRQATAPRTGNPGGLPGDPVAHSPQLTSLPKPGGKAFSSVPRPLHSTQGGASGAARPSRHPHQVQAGQDPLRCTQAVGLYTVCAAFTTPAFTGSYAIPLQQGPLQSAQVSSIRPTRH